MVARVDGDLGPHAPVGMFQGLRRRGAAQPLQVPGPKRPPGSGQPELPHILPALAVQRLKNGAVFAVHRDDGHAPFLGRGHHQGTGGHQGLFVGQGHRQAGVNGGQGGFQAHRPHHGGDHQVGPGGHRHLPGPGPSPENFGGPLRRHQLPQMGGYRLTLHRHPGRAKLTYLFGQDLDVLAGGQPRHRKLAGVFRHHRQGALADGAGGTKNSQALHGADLPLLYRHFPHHDLTRSPDRKEVC